MGLISTLTVGATDIKTARIAFGAAIPITRSSFYAIQPAFAALNGAAATLMFDVEITRGELVFGTEPVVQTKRLATSEQEQPRAVGLWAMDGDSLQLHASSTNTSDSAVTGKIYVWWDQQVFSLGLTL